MKPQLIFLFVLIASLLSFEPASAQGLLMDNCATAASAPVYQNFALAPMAATPLGISCENIRNFQDAYAVMGLALIPATTILRNPTVAGALATDLAAVGLTFANPVVLGVTVIGSVGVATFYVVLRQSLEDCEKQERETFKQEILSELQNKYGTSAVPGVQLEIRK